MRLVFHLSRAVPIQLCLRTVQAHTTFRAFEKSRKSSAEDAPFPIFLDLSLQRMVACARPTTDDEVSGVCVCRDPFVFYVSHIKLTVIAFNRRS